MNTADVDRVADDELADLVCRVALGDHHAFAALYDAVGTRVHALVRRLVRDAAQADEVTQEVFLEVWVKAASYRPGRGGAQSWVLAIAHHRAVDRVRASEASRRRDQRALDLERPGRDDLTVVAVLSSLDAHAVRAAVATLTPLQREAIELAYFDGHTYARVAEVLGIPASTTKTRIRDGLVRLRVALGPGLAASA